MPRGGGRRIRADDPFAVFRRVMSGLLLVVSTAGLLVLFGGVYYQLESDGEELRRVVIEIANALDRRFDFAGDLVDGMADQAAVWLDEHHLPPAPGENPLLDTFLRSDDDGRMSLDILPQPYHHDQVGNLIGVGSPDDQALQREAGMALSLLPLFRTAIQAIENSVWTYYQSRQELGLFLPYAPARDLAGIHYRSDDDVFRGAAEKDNPNHERFFTEVYKDRGGRGLMITVARPVVEAGQIYGIVGIDIGLKEIGNWLRSRTVRQGEIIVYGPGNQLIFHTALIDENYTEVLSLQSALPGDLYATLDQWVEIAMGRVILRDGYFLTAATMPDAPFVVLYVGRFEAVWYALARGSLPAIGVMIAGLIGLVFYARRRVRHDFADPAEKLVSFIAAEGKGQLVQAPDLPAGWRGWFQTVESAFADHGRLVAISQELDMARRLQNSILPHRFPDDPRVTLAARALPAREVGGDFYDFFWLDRCRLALVIADVSGKGMPAALFMAVARTVLRAVTPTVPGPGQAVARINDLLAEDNDAGMFVTLFYAILDCDSGRLVYVNGGHNPPMLVRRDGAVAALPITGGVGLGVVGGLDYDEAEMRLQSGDLLFLFTDGVTETHNPDNDLYGEARLSAALSARGRAAPAAVIDAVVADCESFAGAAAQADDLTILAVQLR